MWETRSYDDILVGQNRFAPRRFPPYRLFREPRMPMPNAPFHSVVYGPLKTRRLGIALGVNPAPTATDTCAADCIFCKTGQADAVPIVARANAVPSAGVIVTAAARRIIGMSKAGEKIDCIVLSGNLDPTRHHQLLTITENLRDLRNKWFPKADLALLTDGSNLEPADHRRALQIYDLPILRFEWGTAKTFSAMTGRKQDDLKTLVTHVTGMDRLILSATFVQGAVDNANDAEVKAWIKRVEELRPKEVQIQTLEAPKAKAAKQKPVSVARLEQIAAQLTEKTGIATTVLAEEPLTV
jgi:wyosine [tRNA(Phe)-imidazoG37] synthetase (radical SAM superfamily)